MEDLAWNFPEDGEFTAGDLICVDFDGTLTQGQYYSWDEKNEQPNEEMCEWVREKYYEGCHIVIWTSRSWDVANIVAARLTEWNVPYHGIKCEKGAATGYVDDKVINTSDIMKRIDRDGRS